MARQNKDTFLLRHDFFPQIKMLTMEQRGRLLTAIYAHATEEELPEMDELTTLCFGFIRASLDANAKKYYARTAARAAGLKKRTVSKKTARFFRKAAVFLQNRQETAKTLLNLYLILILILNLILSLFLNLKRAKKRERNFSRFSFSGISETLQTKSTGSLITTRLPDGCARERRS